MAKRVKRLQTTEVIELINSKERETFNNYISQHGLRPIEVQFLCKNGTDDMIEDYVAVVYPAAREYNMDVEQDNCPHCGSDALYLNSHSEWECLDCGRVVEIVRTAEIVRMICSDNLKQFKSYVIKHELKEHERDFLFDYGTEAMHELYCEVYCSGDELWDN